jgi:hypothetical protein
MGRRVLTLTLALGLPAVSLTAQFLYTVSSDVGTPVLRIDPTTGTLQVLQSTAPTDGVTQGTGTIDVAGRRLFFLGPVSGVQSLVVVDLMTGLITTHPLTGIGLSLPFVEFDPVARFLYSVGSEAGPLALLRIDPSTADIQVLQSTGAAGLTLGTSALDSNGRRLFFLGPGSGVPTLFVVDLTTGITTTHPLPDTALSLSFLEFDSVTGFLYSVSTEAGTPLVRSIRAPGAFKFSNRRLPCWG